jgi:hypothetical protein
MHGDDEEHQDEGDDAEGDATEYDVEKILAVRPTEDGQKEYLIRWLGYDSSHDSWEPPECVSDDALACCPQHVLDAVYVAASRSSVLTELLAWQSTLPKKAAAEKTAAGEKMMAAGEKTAAEEKPAPGKKEASGKDERTPDDSLSESSEDTSDFESPVKAPPKKKMRARWEGKALHPTALSTPHTHGNPTYQLFMEQHPVDLTYGVCCYEEVPFCMHNDPARLYRVPFTRDPQPHQEADTADEGKDTAFAIFDEDQYK